MGTQQLKYLNILLIGDSCLDVYHYGKCEKISPEAPVLVLKKESSEMIDGMAGNVKNNLEAFCNRVFFYTNTEEILKNRYIETRYNQHLLRVDEGETISLKPLDVNSINDNIKYDALVISDYNKGFVTSQVSQHLCDKYKDIPIFVDSKKRDLSCFSNCFVKINKKEHKNITKFGKNTKIIVTLGSDGAMYMDENYSTKEVDVFDVSGAGDVFLSAMASSYLRLDDIVKSINIANICASYSVSKLGTYALKIDDLIAMGIYDDLCI